SLDQGKAGLEKLKSMGNAAVTEIVAQPRDQSREIAFGAHDGINTRPLRTSRPSGTGRIDCRPHLPFTTYMRKRQGTGESIPNRERPRVNRERPRVLPSPVGKLTQQGAER